MRLSDLGETPDEIMRTIVPVFNNRRHHYVEDGFVHRKDPESKVVEKVYELDSTEKQIISLFDGKSSIEEISLKAADLMNLDSKEAYQKVRDLFLLLTKQDVSHPLHAH